MRVGGGENGNGECGAAGSRSNAQLSMSRRSVALHDSAYVLILAPMEKKSTVSLPSCVFLAPFCWVCAFFTVAVCETGGSRSVQKQRKMQQLFWFSRGTRFPSAASSSTQTKQKRFHLFPSFCWSRYATTTSMVLVPILVHPQIGLCCSCNCVIHECIRLDFLTRILQNSRQERILEKSNQCTTQILKPMVGRHL